MISKMPSEWSDSIENYMVEIGGEVTMKGVNQNGKCWRIGINKPEDDSTGIKNDIEEVVQLCKKGGVATSGNYRNYYVKDGKKYAHTIDPRTGYPSEQSILSATIVAEDMRSLPVVTKSNMFPICSVSYTTSPAFTSLHSN